MIVSLLVLALAPIAALFLFFYARDRHREPLFPLAATFLLGAGSLLPSAATSLALERLTGLSSKSNNLLQLFLAALFVVGLVEEGAKFAVVRLYAWNRREFDEPYDGIMYSVAAALGFASVENVLYVFNAGQGAAVLRALLAVPSHAFCGVLAGYFLGEAKFAAGRWQTIGLQVLGLALAVLAHAVYDFMVFALHLRPLLLLMLPVFAALSWVIFFRATRGQAAKSAHTRPVLAALTRLGVPPRPSSPESKAQPSEDKDSAQDGG